MVEEKLEKFEEDEIVSIVLAQRLVADSAYWYGYPTGPAKAPKHSERITEGPHGWEVPFGANSFLVGQAIHRCTIQVRVELNKVSNTNEKVPLFALRERLVSSVRGAVSNYRGVEYATLWPVTRDHMLFGTQSIHVGDFIFSYWRLANLQLIAE